jgi:NAD+ kinase
MIAVMNQSVRRVGLVLKLQEPRVREIAAEIIPWFQSRGIEIFIDQSSAQQYSSSCVVLPAGEFASRIDLVVVLGGDGTFLYGARLVGGSGVPILGVNLGSLGFLTEVKLEEMYPAFERVLSGQFQLEERVLLEVEVSRNGRPLSSYLALNDAVINKGALARMIEFEAIVNSQLVTVTRADGLIISTPTGSTAYSLSAGGPILYPTIGAIIITPICPHTLTNRPVVVPDEAVVEVHLRHGQDVMLTVDGQVGTSLATHDRLTIRKARPTLRLVQPKGGTFFGLLREKLKWG